MKRQKSTRKGAFLRVAHRVVGVIVQQVVLPEARPAQRISVCSR